MIFTEKELDEWRKFSRRMEREFGETTYVGTDYATVLVNYSSELKAMIRPLPAEKHYEYDLKLLSCSGCKKKAVWLCLPTQLNFCCDDCAAKKRKSKEITSEPTEQLQT